MCIVDWTLKVTDLAIVGSTLAGPILAVWASEWRQERKALHERKEWVFRTLWSTRSAKLRPEHVQALNHIDFAYPVDKYPDISDAWRLYNDHLNTDQGTTRDSQDRWNGTAHSLLVTLVHLMATDLNFPLPKSLANQPSYYPRAFSESEQIQREILVALLDVLNGNTSISIRGGKKAA